MLGLSLYLSQLDDSKTKDYLSLAQSLGYGRIFTCLLSAQETLEEALSQLKKLCQLAHAHQMEVSVDTNPEVFKKLSASPTNLSSFVEMGVDILRLDGAFSPQENLVLTKNKEGLKIEFNASSNHGVDHLLALGAKADRICLCHNFYPMAYSGLSLEAFQSFNKKVEGLGLRMAAFVSSNNPEAKGPWPLSEGLVTLESCRGQDIDVQARTLVATGQVDDILISNGFASAKELQDLANVDMDLVSLRPRVMKGLSDLEEDLVFKTLHRYRLDRSAYLLRSCDHRPRYRDVSIEPALFEEPILKRGLVTVVNDRMAHYRGEVDIILQDIPNRHDRNVVAVLNEEEMAIVDLVKPGQQFKFVR